MADSDAPIDTNSFEFRKAALIVGLQREYETFFQPMEEELYAESVEFKDPLITLNGIQAYKNNVEMLAGKSALGRVLFSDCGLAMHSVEDVEGDPTRFATRWTLQFRFKLLPWQPLARFTGVSKYKINSQARVERQDDFWDSINLQPGGDYSASSPTAGLFDMLDQLSPSGSKAAQAAARELPYVLLRRAAKYEVRRYPQHVSVCTEYDRRIDGFGTLGAYTNGANEMEQELKAYVPSIISVPMYAEGEERGPDGEGGENKVMRWPMAVPAMGEGAPPRPSERLGSYATLELTQSRVVAVLGFSDPTTEVIVRGYAGLLKESLVKDGLVAASTPLEEFRLAQFDALNSFGARRSEIWYDLEAHPWVGMDSTEKE